MKKIKNFPIISSKLRFINATVFKLGFLNSGFDQKSNGTRIFSPALKKRFQKPLPRQLFEIFFGTLIRTDRAQNVSVGVVSTDLSIKQFSTFSNSISRAEIMIITFLIN